MLLIGNGRLITRDADKPYYDNGAVLIDGERIAAVGETAALRAQYPGAAFEDACGGLIMPGLINAHEHLYSAFARGMALPGYHPRSFCELLDGLWWRLDRALTLEDVASSAYVSLIDSIRCGVTTVVDHHASYGAIDGSLSVIAAAAKTLGVRACLCFEVSDRDGADKMRRAVRENAEFMKKTREENSGMLAGMMGLHASFTLSDATLRYCAGQMPGEASYHIHVAEARSDADDALEKYGKKLVRRLYDLGILGNRTIAAHCVHVDDEEAELLHETGTIVVNNPQSNMSNAVGCARAVEMARRGILVGLGTDAYTHDMLESCKAGLLIQRHRLAEANAAGAEMQAMLYRNNPVIAERLFGVKTGVLKAGYAADVIVADYDPPTPMTADNFDGHLTFGLSGANVRTTIANGRVLMRGRAILTADEAGVRVKSRERAAALWKRI